MVTFALSSPHFLDEATEAQRGNFPKMVELRVAEPGLNPQPVLRGGCEVSEVLRGWRWGKGSHGLLPTGPLVNITI